MTRLWSVCGVGVGGVGWFLSCRPRSQKGIIVGRITQQLPRRLDPRVAVKVASKVTVRDFPYCPVVKTPGFAAGSIPGQSGN